MSPQQEQTRRFRRQRIEAPSRFAKGSFRMKAIGSHRIILAAPRGATKGSDGRYPEGALRVQAILHPLNEHNPCGQCDRIRMGLLC